MIVTDREPSPAKDVLDPTPPRCQGMLECAERCCAPMRCPRPATARITFSCLGKGCDRAVVVLLMCTVCADHADTEAPPPTRRPL